MNQRIFPMSLVGGCVLLMALILLQSTMPRMAAQSMTGGGCIALIIMQPKKNPFREALALSRPEPFLWGSMPMSYLMATTLLILPSVPLCPQAHSTW